MKPLIIAAALALVAGVSSPPVHMGLKHAYCAALAPESTWSVNPVTAAPARSYSIEVYHDGFCTYYRLTELEQAWIERP